MSPIPPPPGGTIKRPLSAYFPFVECKTSTSFAHDRGMMTSIESIEIAGEECEIGELLAAIVAHWKGWTAAGGRTDEDVLRTTREFVEAWDQLLQADRVTSEEAPEDLASALRLAGLDLKYAPPRIAFYELKGERIVVATCFQRGHIAQRGRLWIHSVRAFRVEDGTACHFEKEPPLSPVAEPAKSPSSLPRPATFWSG